MLLVGCGGLQPVGVAQGPIPQGQPPENPSRLSGVRQSPRSARHAPVTETVLYSFRGYPYDGAVPWSGLTYFKGTFYGTTIVGGVYECSSGVAGCGTAYSITPSGTETVLHSFKGGKDGDSPYARLIVRNGTLYGTTSGFHSSSYGTVFSITPSGHETVLYGFTGSPDGSYPEARLLNVNGTLYGTTEDGGAYGSNDGTVFSITPGGKEKVLHSFGNGTDGASPSDLSYFKGTLYGTTYNGGAYNNGTVFSITPGGKEKVLYSFGASYLGGHQPAAGLVEVSGTLYGTADYGGLTGSCYTSAGCGTVFSITPSGKEKVLYRFSGPDGAYPDVTLLDVNGTLYGTTFGGGAYNEGTVFSITRSGRETVLYSFGGSAHDGSNPHSGLSYVNGTFYGTTGSGGAHNGGTVYSITL
jgi:uncharacterized repeat protein (TIGR03803 family)